ncbi:hypothetical protein KKE03_01525 [Patescibacteria group bacterium]|nr:hypothetical protein [Patescibacteria group bacterium]
MKEKYKELVEKRNEAEKKLTKLLSNFRGVRHEDAAGEAADLKIKIQQAYINNLKEEIASFEK